MNKTININAPGSLDEIKLYQYQEYVKRTTVEGDEKLDTEFIRRTVLSCFLNVRGNDYTIIPIKTVNQIVNDIMQLLSEKPPLTPIWKYNGVEYGMIPNLDEITTGEFIDMEQNVEVENMHLLMSILFRPISKRYGKKYTVADYKGTNQAFEHMPLGIALGALGFFLTIGMQLLRTTLKSSQMKEKLQMKKETSTASGVGQPLSMN